MIAPVNDNQERQGWRGRLLAFALLLPLLITSLFAYQAGNNFELTAGTRKSQARTVTVYVQVDKHPSETKALLPDSPDVAAAAVSLLLVYLLRLPLARLFAPYRSRLLRKLLCTIQFSGRFVDDIRS
ncbi:hypothetical protein [Paenibacillus soyae]|uniref:Uncharacterized protein n=1 Tax=Paenibacillus soyae TaxID=2969249 RepID=A0A9X2MNW0_9BACL|nr:hypothetical protein [Paenibacillus soyae]MCR2804189.1 hypothetical protein [Paenibacillus soyae]